MSDTYKIGNVTVSALGGGWYELRHESLSEPRKVHGKEAADAEAAKLGETPEGHIEPQGDLVQGAGGDIVQPGDTRNAAERAQERSAGLPDPAPPAPPVEPPVADPAAAAKEASEIETLKAQLAAANEKNAALESKSSDFEQRFNDFLKSAQPLVASIGTTGGDLPGVPMQAPRAYSGQMDPATKKMFKEAGIEVKTIVLEENESIPPTGLFVGHNGNSYMISPGEEVDVPDFLLGVLNDAVMSAPVVEGKTQKVLGYRNRSKYPYRLVN
jgi:hypothetical protein